MHGSVLCCYGCEDAALEGGNKKKGVVSSSRSCRMCGRISPLNSPFKAFHSPLDESLENRFLSSELRSTSWCSCHAKVWLKDALQRWDMAVVLAHLSGRAAPVAFVDEIEK